MYKYIFILSIILILLSCNNTEDGNYNCTYNEIEGSYIFFSDSDTSEQIINFTIAEDGFTTTGISGYKFWYPSSPLSGKLNECEIIINSYENVERNGLPSPGGTPRKYYESMDGFGEFYPSNDSIKLFINYKRTENWEVDFSGNIYLKKTN